MREWTTLKKYIWLLLLRSASAIIHTVTGTAPLVLENAIAAAIKSLKQYGKCTQPSGVWNTAITQYGKVEQRNLPQGYTELDYIQSDGGQYIDLNTTLNQDDVIEIEFEISASQSSCNIFGCRAGASANNIMLFFGGTANRVFIDFNNSNYADYRLSYDVSLNTRYKAVISKNRRAILAADGTVLAENTTACPDTITCPSAYLFAAAGTPAYNYGSPCKVYSCRINGKRNLVGAKDVSNVVEMYDKATDAPFVNAGTGTFTAGPDATPSPATPMDIWCNNGKLEYGALGTNLFDPCASAILLNYYRNTSTGELTASNPNFMSAGYIPIKPNTIYVLVGRAKSDNTISAWNRIYWFDANKKFISTCAYTKDTVTVATSPANAAFAQYGINYNNSTTNVVTQAQIDSYNYTFCEGTAEPATFVPFVGGIYPSGTPEVVTDADGNTASVVNLLGVGEYPDSQEIIRGLVTHRVGVKVLTGDNTKDGAWGTSSGASNLYSLTIADSSTDNAFSPLSTHFVGVVGSTGYAAIQDGQFKHGSNANIYYFKDKSSEDVTAFKAFLASQYAAGTPVIVLYPLATETTENVTAQGLTTEPLTVTAEVTVPALVTTTAAVSTPDPNHPLPIWCNNGKLIYSNGAIIADGTPEVLTVSADGQADQTATVESLFAAGDYKDTQEVIGGDITRQTWVVAFDGTENWADYNNVFYVYPSTFGKPGRDTGTYVVPVCSRFKGVNSGFYGLQDGEIEYAYDGSIELKYAGAADTTELKAKLAEWYAAGEPMIVVYPAPDRTESETAQPLFTNAGTNSVSVTANVSDVELECEYMGIENSRRVLSVLINEPVDESVSEEDAQRMVEIISGGSER